MGVLETMIKAKHGEARAVEDLAPGIYEVHTPNGKPVRVEVKAGETAAVEVE